jgi:uncharacterized protein
MFFDPLYLLFIAPPVLLALWAQARVKSTYASASQERAPLSGAAAARQILDSAGLNDVEIEQVPGDLTDHYDPSHKVLRLSSDVYGGRTVAAVGIAAHEAGHALQDAKGYAPMAIRSAAVPLASFGSGFGMMILAIGAMLHAPALIWVGIALFAGVVFFQVVNLPVEFNASTRAKQQLVQLGIINDQQLVHVRKVLDAAAWTYVAGTLQAIMILLYYLMRYGGSHSQQRG